MNTSAALNGHNSTRVTCNPHRRPHPGEPHYIRVLDTAPSIWRLHPKGGCADCATQQPTGDCHNDDLGLEWYTSPSAVATWPAALALSSCQHNHQMSPIQRPGSSTCSHSCLGGAAHSVQPSCSTMCELEMNRRRDGVSKDRAHRSQLATSATTHGTHASIYGMCIRPPPC
jgi:hypothetical protein